MRALPNKRELLASTELTEDEHFLLHWSSSRNRTLAGQKDAIANCIAWILKPESFVAAGLAADRMPRDKVLRVRVAQVRQPGEIERRARQRFVAIAGITKRQHAIWRNRWLRHKARVHLAKENKSK